MEDVLLLQFLRKKGIISDMDIHEFHELTSASIMEDPVYLSKSTDSISHTNNGHVSETEAKELVSKMYHLENGRKYVGEKFDIYKAKEVCERYRGILPISVTTCDVYIAINSQYHNYVSLFKAWFGDNIEQKIVESAIVYWFKDDDQVDKYKWFKYMNEH
jgi:hypothetical protein